MPGYDQSDCSLQTKRNSHRNCHGDTDEEHISAKTDGLGAWLIAKLVVKTPGDGTTQTEWQDHAGETDTGRNLPIGYEEAQVDLEPDEEEEEDETEIGDEIEIGHRRFREDGCCEVGDTTHDGRTEQNATNDLCDNARLSQPGQGVM